MIEVAIIGLGSWGLCSLERLVTSARRAQSRCVPTRIHVIEPAAPGAGVYGLTQPDYLLMNNPCGQLSMYPDPTPDDDPPYGLGLYEWAHRSGYRWNGDACRVSTTGVPVTAHDFLPRRVMAEYLEWFYETLVAAAPEHIEIVHHHCEALDIVRVDAEHECVVLGDSSHITVSYVVLTSGHTSNRGSDSDRRVPQMRPYPVQPYVDTIPPGASVAVSGMGLVATDVVTALTVGRGGSFVDEGDRKRYVRSGLEPTIALFSRSGLSYCAKAVSGVDDTGAYEPVICTPEALAALSAPRNGDGQRHQVDIRAELFPMIFAEMQLRFYAQSARLAESPSAGQAVIDDLLAAWNNGTFDDAVAVYAAAYGPFDPRRHMFGEEHASFTSSKDYETAFYDLVEADLDESLVPGGASPVKCAYEVFRILRDPMRGVIEFGGLSLSSYLDFQQNIRTRVNRLVAGPPALRSQQLLALMDAGVVHVPFGPEPVVETERGRVMIRSRKLERLHEEAVDYLIEGHLEEPTIHRSASPLLSRLYETGRLCQFHYGDVAVGSVDLSCDFHPVSASGCVQDRIWLFGVLTEGIRYFNHYIPSPKSRFRAFIDVQSCVDRIFG